MPEFIVHTNEGKFYVQRVTTKRLRERMFEYIREKRHNGWQLSQIVYCWSQITWQRMP